MINRRGFTLLEMIVVIAIFGILAITATQFLVGMIQNSNYSSLQNEARQNAEKIMADLSTEIRNSGCVYLSSGATSLCSFASCSYIDLSDSTGFSQSCFNGQAVSTGNHVVYYWWNTGSGQGNLYKIKYSLSSNPVLLNSSKVAICSNQTCGTTTCNQGLNLSPSDSQNPTSQAVGVTIQVRQAQTTSSRFDQCAKATLDDTIEPRNY